MNVRKVVKTIIPQLFAHNLKCDVVTCEEFLKDNSTITLEMD